MIQPGEESVSLENSTITGIGAVLREDEAFVRQAS